MDIQQALLNSGYASSVDANPTILNLFLERRFLKQNRAAIKLQGYDLFNQNTGVSRDVNGTTVIDSQNNRLGRYFLLSFNMRVQKFAGKSFKKDDVKKQFKETREKGIKTERSGGSGKSPGSKKF